MDDLISRQWLLECVDEGWIKFDTEEDANRFIHLVRDIAPGVQPVATDTNVGDEISKFIDGLEEIFADLRERHVDDSVCGLCEYDGAYMGQSGDWCNECPGFDKDDCFKLSDKTRKKWTEEIIKALPSAQPERKKGKWIYNSPVTMKCNQCGLVIKDWDWRRFKYCPNCAADMREDGERK